MNLEQLWNKFAQDNSLSDEQLTLFKKYADLLNQWNDIANLTNITDIADVIDYHFDDSLSVGKFIDFQNKKAVCDVGTGGGLQGFN